MTLVSLHVILRRSFFNENFKLVDPEYSIESIIADLISISIQHGKKKRLLLNLKEYDKNILVYLNEYIYAKEHGLYFDFTPDKVNVEHIMPASGHNIETIRIDAGMTKEEFDDMVNLIGNKILLEEDINKHIGMDWFKTKKGTLVQDKKGYVGSNLALHLLSPLTPQINGERKTLNPLIQRL